MAGAAMPGAAVSGAAGGGPDGGAPELPLPPDDAEGGATARRLGSGRRAGAYRADEREVQLVNLALHLRRPLLITGKPGVGKSTLAYAVAHELRLGPVLRWPVTSRTTLRDGLYAYDAIGRLHDSGLGGGAPAGPRTGTAEAAGDTAGGEQARNGGASRAAGRPDVADIGRYLRLGPLGTALLPWRHPRVLLIDEIDKSDLDLPNDLLNVFEEGEFTIPELARLGDGPQRVMTADGTRTATVVGGTVRCAQFPLTVLTSNAEREFPPAFLRRCVRLEIRPPDAGRLAAMVAAHLGDDAADADPDAAAVRTTLIAEFLRRREEEGAELANDQLLNALLMAGRGLWSRPADRAVIEDVLLRPLNES
ncbi:MoxR family ATPase [Actinacidiphila sp. DG2A-62]|uniref:AAA family ATPase n=1 Tax=Actinacidiphila sp. DG2A-62 TaxID=3108821 RepID=UPI002DBC64FC|nr:MoxR family ATPase [Actinacidiphila sp. DG2A-62]MEC3997493.1 MoxR family ATPase [Actinacidiphila sp. DG2A-62]